MPSSFNVLLVIGAVLSALAVVMHLGIIVGGPGWYRFFGAGEELASAAEAGRWHPAAITFRIAAVLGIWSAYALSGAGIIAPLPLLKAALVTIIAIYLLRGPGGSAVARRCAPQGDAVRSMEFSDLPGVRRGAFAGAGASVGYTLSMIRN